MRLSWGSLPCPPQAVHGLSSQLLWGHSALPSQAAMQGHHFHTWKQLLHRPVQSDSEVLFFSSCHSLKASSLMTIPTTTSLASKLHQRGWSSAESFGQCISSPKTSGEHLSFVAAFIAHVSNDPFSPSAEVTLAGSTTLSCIQLHFTAIYPRHRAKNIWSFHTEMPRKHK